MHDVGGIFFGRRNDRSAAAMKNNLVKNPEICADTQDIAAASFGTEREGHEVCYAAAFCEDT